MSEGGAGARHFARACALRLEAYEGNVCIGYGAVVAIEVGHQADAGDVGSDLVIRIRPIRQRVFRVGTARSAGEEARGLLFDGFDNPGVHAILALRIAAKDIAFLERKLENQALLINESGKVTFSGGKVLSRSGGNAAGEVEFRLVLGN